MNFTTLWLYSTAQGTRKRKKKNRSRRQKEQTTRERRRQIADDRIASKPEGGWEKAALVFVSARFDILLWTLFRRQVSQMRREGRATAELSGRFLRTQIACLPSPLPTNKRPPPPPFTPLLRVRLLTESLAFLLQSDGEGRRGGEGPGVATLAVRKCKVSCWTEGFRE